MQKLITILILSFLTINFTFAQDSERNNEPRNRNAKPFMGVTLGTNWGDGVEIKGITKGFGADRAGLQKGDIVTAINKDKINNDDDFTKTIRKYKAGEEVDVTFLRGKENKILKVKLAEAPNSARTYEVLGNIGISQEDLKDMEDDLKDIKEDLRESMEDLREDLRSEDKARIGIYPETDWKVKAVKITGFTSNSPAKSAGMEKGDYIVRIEKNDVNTEEELRYALKQFKPNDEVSVVYLRNGKENKVKLKLGSEKSTDWDKNIRYNDKEGWGTSYSRRNDNNETKTWSSYTFADGSQVDLNEFTIKPSAQKVNIAFDSKLTKAFSVVVYDEMGKEVAREDRPNLDGKFEKEFDLSSTKSNNFVVKLWIDGKEAFSQKVNL